MGFKAFVKRRSLRARDTERTKAAELTIRESLYPIILVTILFFLWGFSYGLLDTLNKYVCLATQASRPRQFRGGWLNRHPDGVVALTRAK